MKPKKLILTIDYTDRGAPRVLRAKLGMRNYVLKGNCTRCGRCCAEMKCRHLTHDSGNAACGLGWLHPFGCRVYPLPEEERLEGCGLYWE